MAALQPLAPLLLAVFFACSVAGAPEPAAAAADRHALLSFRSLIRGDPSRALASWTSTTNTSSAPAPCQWRGVSCGTRGRRRGRVVALDLPGLGLLGALTPALANLTYLRRLHLPGNRLHGALPPDLGCLQGLRHLNLSHNSIQGPLPPTLARCRQLRTVLLNTNKLHGEIPEYGLGNEASIHGDVYSYGILLLEMFTGKRPTSSEFGEVLSLHKHVQMALPDQAANVIDQDLLKEENNGKETVGAYHNTEDMRISHIISILQIGISCSKETPSERIQIGDALRELQTIREFYTH